MFRSYIKKFKYNLRVKRDISEVIKIFTSEDMEYTPTQSQISILGFIRILRVVY